MAISDSKRSGQLKLTALSHGGGCGCKVAFTVLDELLDGLSRRARVSARVPSERRAGLLVGTDTRDDAAVFALDDDRAIVATTDFFTPIVDDPGDFGRIAAANAISDVYAMGATPLFALNIIGMPVDRVPTAMITEVLAGGESVCSRAGVVIAGGHSIDSAEPVYGLAVIGVAPPGRIKSNAGARAGDVLILGKPLGIGIIAAAIRRGVVPGAPTKQGSEAYAELLHWATLLNVTGERLGARAGVHALTDVTGYGLLGHLLEMCRASGAGAPGGQLGAKLRLDRVPVIESARALLGRGIISGAAARNRDGCAGRVDFGDADERQLGLLCDPQTNGGLLVACAPGDAGEVLSLFRRDGCSRARVIGEVVASPGVRLV